MRVVDIMTPKPVTIDQDRSLRAALELMDGLPCHHLPVTGHDGHLVGILSARDCRSALNAPLLLREQWEEDSAADSLRVRALMTPAPIIVEPDAPVVEAVRLMLQNYISSLPVMRAETLVGIVTTSDVLIAFMHLAEQPSRFE